MQLFQQVLFSNSLLLTVPAASLNIADNKRCSNSEITMTKTPSVRSWILPYDGSLIQDKGPSTSSYTLNSDTIIASFQNTGLKTLGIVSSANVTSTIDGYVLINQVRYPTQSSYTLCS